MPAKKTLTSSSSAINSFTNRFWGRCRARIQRMCSGVASPAATPLSPAARLPQEVLEIIIAYLSYYAPSVWACSLTCHSWYTAAVPHLYPTLRLVFDHKNQRFEWSNPIWSMQMPNLFPFVTSVWVGRCLENLASPRLPDSYTLSKFPALNNIHTFTIAKLEIPSSMRCIQHSFGHSLSKVRSLSLIAPKGTCRQIIFFVGLFRNLENLLLKEPDIREREPGDLALIPPFTPPLQGRLTARSIASPSLFKDMIDLFGGIRCYYLDVYDVCETQLLLTACAETLQALCLDPLDPQAESSLLSFDLSQNKRFCWLGVPVQSIDSALVGRSPLTALRLLKHVLATVRPTVQFQVVLRYLERDFRGIRKNPGSNYPCVSERSQAEEAEEAASHRKRFGVVREMRKVRDFSLVLDVAVWEPVGWYSMWTLGGALSAEGEFDGPFKRPWINYRPHTDLQAVRL